MNDGIKDGMNAIKDQSIIILIFKNNKVFMLFPILLLAFCLTPTLQLDDNCFRYASSFIFAPCIQCLEGFYLSRGSCISCQNASEEIISTLCREDSGFSFGSNAGDSVKYILKPISQSVTAFAQGQIKISDTKNNDYALLKNPQLESASGKINQLPISPKDELLAPVAEIIPVKKSNSMLISQTQSNASQSNNTVGETQIPPEVSEPGEETAGSGTQNEPISRSEENELLSGPELPETIRLNSQSQDGQMAVNKTEDSAQPQSPLVGVGEGKVENGSQPSEQIVMTLASDSERASNLTTLILNEVENNLAEETLTKNSTFMDNNITQEGDSQQFCQNYIIDQRKCIQCQQSYEYDEKSHACSQTIKEANMPEMQSNVSQSTPDVSQSPQGKSKNNQISFTNDISNNSSSEEIEVIGNSSVVKLGNIKNAPANSLSNNFISPPLQNDENPSQGKGPVENCVSYQPPLCIQCATGYVLNAILNQCAASIQDSSSGQFWQFKEPLSRCNRYNETGEKCIECKDGYYRTYVGECLNRVEYREFLQSRLAFFQSNGQAA